MRLITWAASLALCLVLSAGVSVDKTATVGGTVIFHPTGSMATGRMDHTATMLLSGKVLIVGGYNYNAPGRYLSSAELYDPVTGIFSSTGKMLEGRWLHTATSLQDGRVLVVGGITYPYTDLHGSRTAELYDPVTGTFTTTGRMESPRYEHFAALLPDGRVLIVGGMGYTSSSTTAELYDPATGTFAASKGKLLVPAHGKRDWALPLPTGKVLIATNPAQLCDPHTDTFTFTGELQAGVWIQTTTLLLNGKVLLTGGGPTADEHDWAQLYDPAIESFTATGRMGINRQQHTAALMPDGKVLIAGGCQDYGCYAANTAELFDPETGDFTLVTKMTAYRDRHTATSLPDGRVLIVGGTTERDTVQLASAELGTYGPFTVRLPITLK